MPVVPALNETWSILDAFVGGNKTNAKVGDYTSRIESTWNSTDAVGDIVGDGNLSDDDDGVWWKAADGSGDFPVVKFGPDLSFLGPLAVYINLLMVIAAFVMVIGVVCRCVAAKVHLSLSTRRGPEIAFHLGATNDDVIERVVAGEVGECRRDGDGSGCDD